MPEMPEMYGGSTLDVVLDPEDQPAAGKHHERRQDKEKTIASPFDSLSAISFQHHGRDPLHCEVRVYPKQSTKNKKC